LIRELRVPFIWITSKKDAPLKLAQAVNRVLSLFDGCGLRYTELGLYHLCHLRLSAHEQMRISLWIPAQPTYKHLYRWDMMYHLDKLHIWGTTVPIPAAYSNGDEFHTEMMWQFLFKVSTSNAISASGNNTVFSY